MIIVYWYKYKGKKFGSMNAYKIQCMGIRDSGAECVFGQSSLDDFLADSKNELLSMDWHG